MSECVIWSGYRDRDGYGRTVSAAAAHRSVWEAEHGPIPEGLELDHLCNIRACVNVAHLEPVTRDENQRRARDRRTACAHGHPWDRANTYWLRGKRSCRACNRERVRQYAARSQT